MHTIRLKQSAKFMVVVVKWIAVLLFLFVVGCMNQTEGNSSPQSLTVDAEILLPTPAISADGHSEENNTVEFTLDAEMVGQLPNGAGSVIFVEYRGNPNYRILQIGEQEDEFRVIYQIPKGHLIYSVAATSNQDQLLMAYTQSILGFENGIYLLNLSESDPQLIEVLPENEGVTYTDISIVDDFSFWVTKADTSGGQVTHSIAEYDFAGNELRSIPNVINPVIADNGVYFLPLEEDNARRKLGYLDPTGAIKTIDILEGKYDLDDFLFIGDQLYVAVLERNKSVVSNPLLDFFSSAVSAHGNHSIPATWVKFDGTDFSYIEDADWGAKIIYDSIVLSNGQILEITNEGLEIIDEERELIIKSRALRLAARSDR